MKLLSPEFNDNQSIPFKYSAYGYNISPPLSIEDVPSSAIELVLVLEDPDATTIEPWQHWLVWKIPPNTTNFKSGLAPEGCIEGLNDSGTVGYSGPRPPSGTHRYIFKLIAVDNHIDLPKGATRKDLDSKIANHIIEQTELIGLYSSKNF